MKAYPLFSALLLACPALAAEAPAPLAPQVLDTAHAASERAATYEDALARAKATGKDIAVFQYGSDWNPASLSLFQNVWSKDALLPELGPGFILVAIDAPEVVGGRAVYGRCTAEKCGLTGFSDTAVGSAPPLHLEAIAKAEPPTSDITAVTSDGGATFAKRADGTFVAQANSANPAQDTLTLTLKPAKASALLRLDFPTDDSLPKGGPGRAGNAVISEIEVSQNGKPLKAAHVWGSTNVSAQFAPWTAIDGSIENTGEGWNLNGGLLQRRTLLLSLQQPVAAGADLSIKLVCKSQWGQHVPGTVRATVVADKEALADVHSVGEAQMLQSRNRAFTFAGWGKIPRISLMDAQGRPVAANPSLPIRLTAKDFATQLKSMRALREKRDALWAKAQTAQGPAKAEWLRQSLDALNLGRDPEFGRQNGWGTQANGPYEPVLTAMKAADPKDESGAVRWATFTQGAWGAVPWAKDNLWTKALEGKPAPTDSDYAAADACIQRELDDPRNKQLDSVYRQQILKARYDLRLHQAKGNHEDEKVLAVQRQIAAIDPTTFWGTGAVGYLGMYRRSEQPFLNYGFNTKYQAKTGSNVWLLADAWQQVDHAGAYNFTVAYQAGQGSIRLTRVAVVLNGKELGVGTPRSGEETLDAAHRVVEIPFVCTNIPSGAKVALKLDYVAGSGPQDLIGAFAVEPLLVEE